MDSKWLHLAVYGLIMGTVAMLWHRLGKPWCDRVSEAQRYPRLTRIGLVAFLYFSVCAVLIACGYIAHTLQQR